MLLDILLFINNIVFVTILICIESSLESKYQSFSNKSSYSGYFQCWILEPKKNMQKYFPYIFSKWLERIWSQTIVAAEATLTLYHHLHHVITISLQVRLLNLSKILICLWKLLTSIQLKKSSIYTFVGCSAVLLIYKQFQNIYASARCWWQLQK